MKVVDILSKMKVGCIVTDKRILSVLKRKGLIFDYSKWGYLESCRLCYPYNCNGKVINDSAYVDLFPKGNAPKLTDRSSINFDSYDEMRDFRGYGSIEYQGCKFDTKYLSGCFNAYLQLVEKNGNTKKEMDPKMSLWGNIY